ncbi:copper homeostasis CutC domain-containing protein, partial [Coniella lustricola]
MSNNSNNNNNHSPKHPLEVPVFSPTSAALALAAGAQRLELNRAGSYPNGGLTPSIADLEVVACGCGGADVPVRVMIRPRGAGPGGGDEDGKEDLDFVYTDAEFEEMKQCMEVMIATPGLLRPERGDGFVFGVLKKQDDEDREKEQDGEGKAKGKAKVVVDVERNSELVRLAGGLPCVFHRAF